MFLGLWTPITIRTNLPRSEVIERLAGSIDPPSISFPFFASFGPVGRVRESHCWFENRSYFEKNLRRLTLRYEETEEGTILTGQFAPSPFQLLPLLAIFIAGLLLCFNSLIYAISHLGRRDEVGFPAIVIPFAFLLGGLLMVKLNLWFGKGRENELIEALEDILKRPPRSAAMHGEIFIRPRRRF